VANRPQNYGAEPTLRKLARLSSAWLAFHGKALRKVKTADWERLLRPHAMNDRKNLQA
jgi:hypothetical protein